ncbi:MAG: TolC family protein [Bdellovibrionales bacterium]|nr:TolC family protein [Oligoflexia bacterium]
MKLSALALLILFISGSSLSRAATLTLEDYLAQVEGKNQYISAAKDASKGAGLSTAEAELVYSPALFAEVNFLDNHFRNALFPSAYRSLQSDTYTVGIRQETAFGLKGSLSYLYSHQGYLGTLDQQTLQFIDRRFWEGTPKLELSLSLWRNFRGEETRANESIVRSNALARQYNESFQVKATRAEAESTYVRLVSAQQLVNLYKESFSDAQDILSWNNKRMQRNLGETADVLQAQGNFEAQKLSLQASEDEEKVAARNFNRFRNLDSDSVPESLSLPGIEGLTPPARSEVRDDVKAAQENARLQAAQGRLGIERNSPTLEAYGSVALNARESSGTDTFSRSFQSGQQTTLWGVRLNIPMAISLSSDVRHGYELERNAAETLVSQKLFDQEVEWKDLVQQLSDAKRRYDIAGSLSKIQRRKVANERIRLHSGRTTTYQTLIFNIDFNSAEVARIQAQSSVLNILARMKTYGESKL